MTRPNAWPWAAALLLVLVGTAEAANYPATWTQRFPARTSANQPGGRAWVDMLYDPVIKETVLFAGSGSFYFNDVLSLSVPLNRWAQKEPFIKSPTGITPPCPRDEYAFEYDSFNDLYWSFGGTGYDCSTRSSTTQSGTTTTVIVDPTLPATTDDFYKDWVVNVTTSVTYWVYVTGYDATTKSLTLASPVTGLAAGRAYTLRPQTGGGTWSYDPATRRWRNFQAPSTGYTGAKPPNRLSPAFAYSSRDSALVMFGGQSLNDTWALDAQTQTWVRMLPNGSAASPPARAQVTNSMVYDSFNDVFVLFGGRCGDSGTRCKYGASLNDTWVYKLSTNTWTRMQPAVSPPVHQQHQMAYDPVHHVVVLFGGHSAPTFYNDIWVYDYAANTWQQVPTPAVRPAARYLGALTYDAGIGEFVLYGGNESNSASAQTLWTLKLTSSTGGNQSPVARISISPGTGTTATTFSFSGSSSTDADGSIVSYAWDFGDGTTASGAAPSKQYATAGSYTVKLTVRDDDGATGVTTVPLTVSPSAAPSVSLSTMTVAGAVQDGSVSQITVNGSPVTFTTGANGTWSVTFGVSARGTYTIAVTASGSGTTTRTITVNAP
jgi:PKD repeat protein